MKINPIEYLRKLTLSGGKESSKRFIALFTCLLVSYVVLRFTTEKNLEMVLVELLFFILSLLGLASYENHKGLGNTKEEPTDDNQQS